MIYRSRYLNRLMFSPSAYRDRFRQAEPRFEAPRAASREGELGERAPYLSSRELRDIVERCEEVITAGSAQIEDYEAFVICQQELANRA